MTWLPNKHTVGVSPSWHGWTVCLGLTPLDGETYPTAELAQARADWLNGRAT